jgi:hypothetical protein
MKSFIVGLFALFAMPVSAQEFMCARLNVIESILMLDYNERKLFSGFVNENTVFHIYVNARRQTWTTIVAYPDNTACVITKGVGYEFNPYLNGPAL